MGEGYEVKRWREECENTDAGGSGGESYILYYLGLVAKEYFSPFVHVSNARVNLNSFMTSFFIAVFTDDTLVSIFQFCCLCPMSVLHITK